MNGIKAEWRLSELDLDTDDPFDTMILSTGLTVDLTGSQADIESAIRRTLEIEGRLDQRGITCQLKDEGTDCRSCPAFARDEGIVPLCHLGHDQQVLVALAVARNAPFVKLGGAYAPFATLADRAYAAALAA